ncbi:bifunctional 5,10-methylenetetrahydrofolate dehydrogenase/5,10-methenyltetrahydrofolate cyclohydrolase [Candidatus Peregrinibacteria bacterium]|nr:bifunctional 5,10-methylenetetrahydrofolate dehydrogenase/5,10-methenyltetrahydrofolate cyclohydrolase [Candidatus Peregrinibacteria bacterium]
MQILDGKKVASRILAQVKKDVSALKKKKIIPKLLIISVGEHAPSEVYIRRKTKACEQAGIQCEHRHFTEKLTFDELIDEIEILNADPLVSGIIVQLPLPPHIETPKVMKAINPYKDVDGFHAYNLGKMFLSSEFEYLAPSTPAGVIELLQAYDIEIEGRDITVIGHSNLVGKPLSIMLLNRNATVTTCHKYTKNLKKHTRNAEILIVAVGKPNLITADMVKNGAIVVDVGINRLANGALCGDVDFPNVSKKAKFITPVPGGIGPMTVACLLRNVVRASTKSLTFKL